ncbi:hypothetical protein Tco_1420922 [Tanacetum coccineum]
MVESDSSITWIRVRSSQSLMCFFSSGTPGLDPVPSLETLETNVDSSGTPSMLPVPSFEPPVLGCLLLIFIDDTFVCYELQVFMNLWVGCSKEFIIHVLRVWSSKRHM